MENFVFSDIKKQSTIDGIERLVVGAIIMAKENVLLLQRPEKDFMGGIYELPSGKVENHEELDKALKREVLEETGLQIRDILSYVGHFDYLSKSNKRTRQFNFVVEVSEPYDVKLSEHEAYAWVSMLDVSQYAVTDSTRNILSQVK